MNKLSKRAISIIVIATFLISMIPIMPAQAAIILNTDYPVPGDRNQVGDTIVVKGTGVTAGATVNLYWDYVTTAGLMNNTVAKPSGAFEVWVNVPDTPAGDHYIWVKDMETALSDSVRVVVLPKISISASSGLAGEDLDVDGTGFGAEDDMTVYFGPIQSSAYQLIELYGDSTADWVTDPATDGTEDVVKLVGDSTSEAKAAVYIKNGPKLDGFDPSSLAFMYYGSGVDIPLLELRFEAPDCVDPDDGSSLNRGHLDITFTRELTVVSNVWTKTAAYATTDLVQIFGNVPDTGADISNQGATGTFATIEAAMTGDTYTFNDWVLTRISPQTGWGVTGTCHVDDVEYGGDVYNLTSPVKTLTSGEDGSFSTTFTIPDLGEGIFNVSAVGTSDFWDSDDFIIGACITLDKTSGPSGTVVTINGRGFIPDAFLDTITLGGTSVLTVDDTVILTQVDGSGKFEVEVVIPNNLEKKYDLIVTEDGPKSASAKFKVDGEAVIKVSPTYGSPGATITVKGYNFTQIAGIEVEIDLLPTAPISHLVTAKTKADGTFENTFTSPAVEFKTYEVTAVDKYSITAKDAFKVGLIAFIINPIFGESGTNVGITGIGFSNGPYNLTFGEKLYAEHGTVSGEAISDPFYVPNVEPGTYHLTVIDTDENELTVQFIVTESTYVSIDPALAPNEYNVTIKGFNFADSEGVVDFVIYNSTDEWDMAVTYETVSVKTDKDGNFTGYWKVLPKADISLGDYTINVTGPKKLFVQVPFSVVAARVSVEPRKAQFDRGDTIQFDIKNDFILDEAYIEIYDPNDILYWSTEPFVDAFWMQVAGLYTVPYYRQTDEVGNPMELQSDAPMGTWLYILYYEGDELMNGTFAVGPSTAAQVDAMLEDVRSDLAGLAEDLAGLSDDFADDMAALSVDFADEIAGLSDDIAGQTASTNAMGDRIDDLEGSMSDLGDSMVDIADASNSAADAAADAADAAADAVSAAEEASGATQGLTTLVYGAIGASLIAALAAIISLMQISKKIAG